MLAMRTLTPSLAAESLLPLSSRWPSKLVTQAPDTLVVHEKKAGGRGPQMTLEPGSTKGWVMSRMCGMHVQTHTMGPRCRLLFPVDPAC